VRKSSTALPLRRRKPVLGQHFLRDEAAAQRIIEALGDLSGKTVLEIGPGTGALTRRLIARARRVIAIELDKVLAAQLRMGLALVRNAEIIEGDVLAIDFDTIFGPKPGNSRPGLEYVPQPATVVGNLPYYITSDILLRLFAYRRYFDTLVIMVQRELADRIVARPGSRDYGLLSATAQLYAKVERLFSFAPGSFTPPPKVHSTVLRLTLAPQLEKLGVAEDRFIHFLKLSFGQKRKTLWNNLKLEYDAALLRAALEQAGISANVRAEALPLEKAAALFRALSSGQRGS